MIHHFVYISENLITGQKYIGDHSTNVLEDGYLGSGKYILRAIKKYGRENFKREILESFQIKKEAFEAQEKYINEYNTLAPRGYNISPKGGLCLKGSYNHTLESKNKISENSKGISKNKGAIKTKETKEKISNTLKEKYKNNEITNGFKNKKVSEENKKLLSQIHTGKKLSDETKKN